MLVMLSILPLLLGGYHGEASAVVPKALKAQRTCSAQKTMIASDKGREEVELEGFDIRLGVRIAKASDLASRYTIPRRASEPKKSQQDRSIVIVGGGVSGVFAALTLAELGYTNVTILEKELRVGGKAASFEHAGKQYPLGAVGTPLALDSASFAEEQLFERPLRFARSLFGATGRRLQVLNANNLVLGGRWPTPFPHTELTSPVPVYDWQSAFGAEGRPERFYPHRLDFAHQSAELATTALPKLVPRWGTPQTSWPLVYVSAHGYGVAQAADVPPYYYWARFAQKATNAGAGGPLGMRIARGAGPIGPRGPALRGWASTSLFERKLLAKGIRVRAGAGVTSIRRGDKGVTVATSDGRVGEYEKLILASDLKGALSYLDADANEKRLFGSIIHQPYYTVASHVSLPWLSAGSVYYLGDNQAPRPGRNSMDAGRATAGCPTILLKAHRDSNLTLSWAYGGQGIGAPQMEHCLRSEVERMGGRFGGIQFIKPWHDYFPHFDASTLRQNLHQELDALQGRKRTYMVGEIFNLPLVSECVDFARYLIRREFGRGGDGDRASKRAAVANSPQPAGVPA
jgi:glycine/D-amino acid oxidase-like deaminating enzyme